MYKAGYYVTIWGFALQVNKVLSLDYYEVTLGSEIEGHFEGEELQEMSGNEIEQWEKDIEKEREEQRKKKGMFDEFGRKLHNKICVDCGCNIVVIEDYDVCSTCADAREGVSIH